MKLPTKEEMAKTIFYALDAQRQRAEPYKSNYYTLIGGTERLRYEEAAEEVLKQLRRVCGTQEED